MKLWVLFEIEHDEYGDREGLGRAVGASFDAEQANELVRAMTIAHWRAHPDVFAKRFEWTLKSWGYAGIRVDELDDDTLAMLCEDDERYHAVFEAIEVDVDGVSKAKPDRRRAMLGLAALLRPWSADAARALEEDT